VTKLEYNEEELILPRMTSLRLDSSPFVSKTMVRTASEFLPTQNVSDTTPSSGEFTPPPAVADYRFEQQMTEHRTGINHSAGETPSDVAKLQPDTKVYSRLRQELSEAMALRYSGDTRYVGLEAGSKTELTGHPNSAMNATVFITSVTHSGSNGSYDGGDEFVGRYDNAFEAIPAGTAYRPERITPWPHVGGSHTGVVVGPPGEEIYTDKHGRVQVVFKWDEENSTSLEHSCWIRVAQSFAGNRFGMVFLPRVTHEVMVEFLDGNPDNPIVVGSLYNAQNLPPWTLPDNKTQSGVRTHSTLKGGSDNFNELRFEDKIKNELIYVQAEKDMTTLVKNDELRTVKHDRTTVIHNNEEKTVEEGWEKTTVLKGEQFITVSDNNRWLKVEKDNNITVNGNEYVKVTKNREVTVSANQIHTITEDNTFTIDGKQEYTIKKDDTKTVKEGDSALTVKEGNISIKASMGSISIEAMQKIELKVGSNSIVIDMTGIKITGTLVEMEGKGMATVKAPMTQIKGDGIVIVKGGVTMIN
jgi:type VI secretion system secreted protein VgrG